MADCKNDDDDENNNDEEEEDDSVRCLMHWLSKSWGQTELGGWIVAISRQ